MTYIVEILNPAHESIETFTCAYQPFVWQIDHTGRHLVPETQQGHFDSVKEGAWQELFERPGHTAIIFDASGTPLGVIDVDDD